MRRFLGLAVVVLGLVGPAAGQEPAKPLSRIAFGSCADQDRPLPIFDKIADQKPELLILLGDTIYADLHLEKGEKVTPERIKQKYDILAGLPGWKRLRATCPVLATWDDHDYGKNDAGADWPLKDQSQKLFLDFWGVPADSPRRRQKGVYSAAVLGPPGKRVQVILMDLRYFRSPLKKADKPLPGTRLVPYAPNTDPGATMLGEEQWAWLAEQLKQPAELRLLCSSVQLVPDEHPFEKWANFPAERDRLYKLIRDTKATGVVVLSGDRHLGELSLDPAAVGYPLYDLTSSGFNQAEKEWRSPEKNRHRVSAMAYGDNFGVVTVDWSAADPVVGLQLRDVSGEITVRQTFPLSLLRPREERTAVKRPEGVIGPEEARAKVGQEAAVQFRVEGGRGFKERILLNSEKDYRSEKNFTAVVSAKALTGKLAGATYETFKGKTVRVRGKVTTYNDQVEIVVEDAKQLEIVEN